MRKITLTILVTIIIVSLGRSQTLNVPDNIGTSTNVGNVGIGTTSPMTSLDVYSTTGIRISNANPADNNTYLYMGGYSNTFLGKSAIISVPNAAGWFRQDLYFALANGNDINSVTTSDVAMTIKSYVGSGKFGYVGIGTTNPSTKLDVAGEITLGTDGSYSILGGRAAGGAIQFGTNSATWDRNLHLGFVSNLHDFSPLMSLIHQSGNVGIGTTSPEDLLQVGEHNTGKENNIAIWTSGNGAGEQAKLRFKMFVGGGVSNSTIAEIVPFTYVTGGHNRLDFRVGTWNNSNSAGSSKMSILSNGNVGIGTTNPQSKLAVNGTITSTEVVVTTEGWSDFVFNPNYKLKNLEEVENFIKENNHLPDVPSGKEVLQNGIQLGEMNATLLQKIEELTLYMIEQNKKTDNLIEKVETLESENDLLKTEINNLKTQ